VRAQAQQLALAGQLLAPGPLADELRQRLGGAAAHGKVRFAYIQRA
jgi:hypothetical protein